MRNEFILSEDIVPCTFADRCSGCQLLGSPYKSQISLKLKNLQELLNTHQIQVAQPLEALSAGIARLRDRLDFTLHEDRLGLFEKDTRNILDLDICAQLSPALQNWLTEFRTFDWNFKKASIRLRVGPTGQKGVWLDLANLDVKGLLEEKNQLQKLQETGFVEIGQRRKVPELVGNAYKLRDPELRVWFQTWMNETPVDLYCSVASFTQPSLQANKIISQKISAWLSARAGLRVIEFGSGIGNLTLPALAAADSVLACEIDALSLQGLEKTLEYLPSSLASKTSNLKIHRGDFQKKLSQDFSKFDLVLANPPRSGLKGFLDSIGNLQSTERPDFFIYMSCYPESMVQDLTRLQSWGYEVKEMCVMDQFPQTLHYEVLTLLQRK